MATLKKITTKVARGSTGRSHGVRRRPPDGGSLPALASLRPGRSHRRLGTMRLSRLPKPRARAAFEPPRGAPWMARALSSALATWTPTSRVVQRDRPSSATRLVGVWSPLQEFKTLYMRTAGTCKGANAPPGPSQVRTSRAYTASHLWSERWLRVALQMLIGDCQSSSNLGVVCRDQLLVLVLGSALEATFLVEEILDELEGDALGLRQPR